MKTKDKQWNIVIARDVDEVGALSIWRKPFWDGAVKDSFIDADGRAKDLKKELYIFTDSEFSQLIDCLRKLPDGYIYAKIAELGKREVDTDAN